MTPLTKPLVDIETTKDTRLGNGRWLSLHEVTFNDPSGTERKWELCRRIKPAAPGAEAENKVGGASVDSVDVVAVVKNSKGQATNVILVVQYRPAIASFSIEFPSGLIDAGEQPEQAALRELAEETGFSSESGQTIKVVHSSMPVSYEPGLTASCTMMVVVEIEMEQNELSESGLRKTKLDDDEWSLQVVVLPLTGLLTALKDLQESVGGPSKLVIDSRLYAWAVGREFSI
ncbi:hypothetical protein EMPS_06211 [Entomortierella parvispora]|uniref:Nudix hydrolase domain-containing protein n=1 Tax=Entomortierella parvispora TaxID=205924 RepID=A0A9P3LX85_9FUNG|nr:hypothetical protein EMPS_06211 [Entomortierella parvispora]